MRHRFIAGLLLFLAMTAQCVAAEPAPDPEQQRRLAEQKLKLVDMLVNSPKAQASSATQDAETAALVERSKNLLKQAREALAAKRYADAAKALDEALQSVSKANSRNAGGLSDSVQKQRLQEMTEQVVSYRTSLAELVKDKGASTAKTTLQRVDILAEEGRKLAATGHLGEANKKMAEAYKLEVEEVSRLRAGQEVVISLKFETPADEYAYEKKRFQSNEILVGMMIGEGRAEGDKRRLVDGFLKEAAKLKEEAVALAQSNRYKDAVATMEKAGVQLNRALQSMGVPVF
jgi:tetratricopeptide (TPR) repeat protein